MAAMGKQLKQSVNVFHNLTLYLLLPRPVNDGLDSSLTLVVETVDTIDGSTLMVASQYEEVLGIFDLVSQQQADGF